MLTACHWLTPTRLQPGQFDLTGVKALPISLINKVKLETLNHLRGFDTVFSAPYLAFSIGVLPTFPSSERCGNYGSFWKKIEVKLNVFFQVIDSSMETINQKYENR